MTGDLRVFRHARQYTLRPTPTPGTIGRMLTGFRVLWRALVHFWDESLLMMRTNVFWFVVSLPLYLLTVLVCGIFMPPVDADGEGRHLPWVMSAFSS